MLKLSFLIYFFILTSSALYGVYSFTKLKYPYRVLVVLIVLSCIKELVDKMVYTNSSDGNYLNHFLLILTLVLNLFIYLPQWGNDDRLKRNVLVITLSFFVFIVLNIIYFQGLLVNPTNNFVFLCIQMVGLSLLSFKVIINSPADESIYKKPLFWLSVSNLFFYNVVYLILTCFHFFKSSGVLGEWIPFVSVYANYFLYSGYIVAIYFHKINQNVQHR